jgi:GAF domain-containing protein
MSETLIIPETKNKREIYSALLPQISALIAGEADLIANLANIVAVLDTAFSHLWTGFYITKGNDLVLGPFQGPIACTRIAVKPNARGVCGAAWAQQKTLIVPDVEKFPGHIACSSLSRSEIVVPLIHKGETALVLDIDSVNLNSFDKTDAESLEAIMRMVEKQHYHP